MKKKEADGKQKRKKKKNCTKESQVLKYLRKRKGWQQKAHSHN